MKLSQWAKNNGLCYKTAWTLFKTGKLPAPALQLSTGTILVFGSMEEFELAKKSLGKSNEDHS